MGKAKDPAVDLTEGKKTDISSLNEGVHAEDNQKRISEYSSE